MGWAKYKKYIRAREIKMKKKIHARQLILKNISWQWPKKNSYKEFDNENFLRLENFPPPTITFLKVRPL